VSAKSPVEFLEALEQATALIKGQAGRDSLLPLLYTPDSRISPRIEELTELAAEPKPTADQRRQAGVLMEQVAYLAFRGLLGHDVIKSYRSAGPQIDLLVSGSGTAWRLLCSTLRIDVNKRGILVEAKARKSRVDDQDFARLCALLESTSMTSSLGVFFSLHGATGFAKGERAALRHARLRQVLHFARCRTPVIVFDLGDLQKLTTNGSLVRLLEQKIRDVEELAINPPEPAAAIEVELPHHLQDL
jgi:hypothetical protein